MKPEEDPGRLMSTDRILAQSWSCSRVPRSGTQSSEKERQEDPWAYADEATGKVAVAGEEWLHVHQGRPDPKDALEPQSIQDTQWGYLTRLSALGQNLNVPTSSNVGTTQIPWAGSKGGRQRSVHPGEGISDLKSIF